MTKKEKVLLLVDLCARLPYGVKIKFDSIKETVFTISELGYLFGSNHDIIPHLRPMSSMTEEERGEFRKIGGVMSYNSQRDAWVISAFAPEAYDWLNAHHFDYRDLIEMGLALPAQERMYNEQNI